MKTNNVFQAILATAALGVLLFSSANSYAEGPAAGEMKKDKAGWEERKDKIYKKLGLSEEQQQKLREHRQKRRESNQALREQVKAKREELKQELQKTDFDANKVRHIHNEIKTLRSQKEDSRIEGIIEVRSILTPQQYQKFMELKEEFKGKHRKGDWKDKRKFKEGFKEGQK